MKQAYQIVYSVLETFRGLPGKLERMTTKSDDWWRSHGYEPRATNPTANGNKSVVDEFMAFAEMYEAGAKGAGVMLSTGVHTELMDRWAERYLTDETEEDLHVRIIGETSDVEKWLARFDIKNASPTELCRFEDECDEAMAAIHKAKSRSRITRMGLNLMAADRVAGRNGHK